MKELRCPHCQKVFTVDESEYAELLNQVKNDSFNEELNRRIEEIHKTHEAEQKAALADLKNSSTQELLEKDRTIDSLQQQLEASKNATATQIELAVSKKEQELSKAFSEKEAVLNAKITEKASKIDELNNKILSSDSDKKLALMEAELKAKENLQAKEDEINQLKHDAELNKQESKNDSLLLQQKYEQQIRNQEEQHKRELEMKDEVIAQYKDFKTKQSTKGIGESLEVYCSNQYEQMVRPYLTTAEFGKDNTVVDGTKGDFVFRDFVDGIESVSIMFEMKNEADETEVKHKNSDFYKKLDSDRKKKNCEYGVLVTLLELDNDLYNNGIYCVPNYDKMYVVRPQQFLTIISLLVQMGRNTIKVKKELADAKSREIDVTKFEEKLDKFKNVFSGHVKDAANRYNDAIADIDKAIANLQGMKENLRLWVEHLYKAENNFGDITIRKLTSNNPTMKAMLDEAREQKEDSDPKESSDLE